jgi:hypothetical protein
MLDDGLSPLLALLQGEDLDNIRHALYALGSLAENDEVWQRNGIHLLEIV